MNTYPKTEKYESKWIEENWMGPNPLQLLEELCNNMNLSPGMKVLDMGCGKGLTSIFLAKEFDVTVFANDLWIDPTENLERFKEAGVDDKVFPLKAEAHGLPYAEGFFDAAIAIDSYQYYGADEIYFPVTFSKLVKQGGQFGIVCPGLMQEFKKGYPETHESFWYEDMFSFHSADWWKNLWEKTELVDITSCYNIPDAKKIWYSWAHWARENLGYLKDEVGFDDIEFLDADTEDQITLLAMTAVKK
ncbi:methyltransferase domain-containing protein [Methanobrevibacter sp. TMH8]|uniref:SAM-dependent methyltransferase n=1 Tax=Methanobrevibacter sp. TMH8 TaxID=2848611 RepID=UPI001CCEB357|nr:methyltransferase domain-containing protein [Methanobrevibacter sp. TMH8]MBZ9570591.1 methyltransferase domain-containing protein [Methanobrevibacter sp. TMH8]